MSLGKLFVSVGASAYFLYYAQTAKDWHFIDNFNLMMHEAGHSIFFFTGEFTQAVAGSAFQILVPLVFAGYFYLRRDFFSGSLLIFWAGQNIINVSVYASDSVAMQLPLICGDACIHDWNYILNSLGMIRYTDIIGHSIYVVGVSVIILAMCLSVFYSRKSNIPKTAL